jgi:hypothetical protein
MNCIQQINDLLSMQKNNYLTEEKQQTICNLVKTDLNVLTKVNINILSKQNLEEISIELIKKPLIINDKDLLLCYNNTFYNCDPMLIFNEIKKNKILLNSWSNYKLIYYYVLEQIFKGAYGYSEIKTLYKHSYNNLIYCLLVFKSIIDKNNNHITNSNILDPIYIKNNYLQFISNLKEGIHINNEKNEKILHPESTKILNHLLKNILCNCINADIYILALLNDFSEYYPYFNNVLHSVNFNMQQIIHLSKYVMLNQNAINYLKQIILQNLSVNPQYCGCKNIVDKIVNFEGIIGIKFIFAGSDYSNIDYKLINNKKICFNTYHYQPVFNNKGIVDIDIHLKSFINNNCSTLAFLNSFVFKNKDHKKYFLKKYGYNVYDNFIIMEGNIKSKPYRLSSETLHNSYKYQYIIDVSGNKDQFKTYIINIDDITFANYKTIDAYKIIEKKTKNNNLFNWQHLKLFTSYQETDYDNKINNIINLLENNSNDIDFIALNTVLIPNFIYSSNIQYSRSCTVNIMNICKKFLLITSNKNKITTNIILIECLYNYLMCYPDFILENKKFAEIIIQKQCELSNDFNATKINDNMHCKLMFVFLYKRYFKLLKDNYNISSNKLTVEELKNIDENYEKYKFDDATEIVYEYIMKQINDIKSYYSNQTSKYLSATIENILLKFSNATKYIYFYKQLMCLIYIDAKNINPPINYQNIKYQKSSLDYLINEYNNIGYHDKLNKCKVMHNKLSIINSKLSELCSIEDDNKNSEIINWIDTINNIINYQNVLTLNPLDELVLEFDAN